MLSFITNQVNPRLCRGDSSRLTVPGVVPELLSGELLKHKMRTIRPDAAELSRIEADDKAA